jgi:hypothetical protein
VAQILPKNSSLTPFLFDPFPLLMQFFLVPKIFLSHSQEMRFNVIIAFGQQFVEFLDWCWPHGFGPPPI